MRAGLGMTVVLILISGGEAAGLERCEPTQATFDRMIGLAAAPSPELIADAFILQGALAEKPDTLTRFWIERGGAPGNLADLIAAWPAGTAEQAEVASQQPLLETLRAVRSFVVAFEAPPPSAEEAAERLSANLPPQVTASMSRATYQAEFVAQVSEITRTTSVSSYAAVLMAAQVMRNHLDELQGVPASALMVPDDPYQMRLWDQSIRQEPLRAEADRISALPDGAGLLNDFLIERPTVIGCAAAAMAEGRLPLPPPARVRVPGFPTAGYSNSEFLDAIYQGETEQIELGSVGFYLTAFTGMFTRSNITECRGVISTATAARIAAAGSADVLGQIFGGLVEAHRDRGDSRDDLFAQGFGAGAGTFGGMALSEAGAEADAKLFYSRHGCDSLVAKRFFDQVKELAWQD